MRALAMTEQVLIFQSDHREDAVLEPLPQVPGRLEKVGLFLRERRRLIVAVQWAVIIIYAALVIIPSLLPIPAENAHIWDNLRLFAQFCFWGLWWPGVMIATATLGRVWCGLLCPEGSLTELASKHGLGRAVPRWLRWSGWPLLSFVGTTVYGQLVSVYEYPQAALLVLGGSTVAAIAVGFRYGREKRIWCRYLCPASGVFALLAKIAPLHYRVDRSAWNRYPGKAERINCATLLDTQRMVSASQCHACGRCAGQHKAIALAVRSPFAEILNTKVPASTSEAITLLFGVLGIATAAFQWTLSPWLLQIKITVATWLVDNDYYGLLASDAPWWLLTHYPAANDLFTWLDGALILGYLLIGGTLLGSWLSIGPLLAARIVKAQTLSWQRLSLSLIPLGAASVILGLSMLTVTHLRAEHLWLGWLPYVRSLVLAGGCLASLWLAFLLLSRSRIRFYRRLLAGSLMCIPTISMAALWGLVFFWW